MTFQQEHKGFSAGATVKNLYVEREVKVFAVHEFEYNSLSNLSTFATLAFSVAGAAFAYSMGIYTNAAFAEKLTAAGELATRIVAPILLVVSLLAAGAGLYALAARGDLWSKIKKQSTGS